MRKRTDIYSLYLLRIFLSVLIVFYHSSVQVISNFNHLFFFNIFRSGLSAVDVFFMLSGYLLAKLYSDKKLDAFFFIRRLLKIYPIYLVGTFAYLPFYLKHPHIEPACNRFEVAWKSLLLFPQACSPVLSISWILTHQVYFYLLFMLFYFKFKKFRIIPKIILTVSFIFFALGLTHIVNFNFPYIFFFSGFLLEFFFGVFIAKFRTKLTLSPQLSWTLASLLYFSGNIFEVYLKTPFRVLVYGLMSFFILDSFLYVKNDIFPRKFLGFLKILSNATYSIFLFHFPIISILSTILIKNDPGLIMVNIYYVLFSIAAIISGVLIYLFVERPLSFWFKKLLLKNYS